MNTRFEAADKLARRGAAGQALQKLREQMRDTTALSSKEDVEVLAELLSRCFRRLKQHKLELASSALVKSGADPEALHRLGFQLVSAQLPDLAAAVLAHGLRVAPEDERILLELSAALETQGRYREALEVLRQHGTQGFMPRYLTAFNTLMSGDIGGARALAAELAPATEGHTAMRDRLGRIFARADAVAGATTLDAQDHRGWHFILTGGLLLHLPDPAAHPSGHYESLEDSERLCKEGILRLAKVLECWGRRVPKVLSFDNPESHRLGLAFSELLGVPEKTVVVPDEPGLLVIYDQASVIDEVYALLAMHSNDIRLYTHACQFSREYKVAPDFTNLEYGSIVSPWNRHTIFPPRPELPTAAPTGTDAELAHEIVAAEVPNDALADIPALLRLAAAAHEMAAGTAAAGAPREKHWHGRMQPDLRKP